MFPTRARHVPHVALARHRKLESAAFLAASFSFLLTLGCGSTPAPPAAPVADVTGNWQFQTAPSSIPDGQSNLNVVLVQGSLTSQGSQVSGILRLENLSPGNGCGPGFQVVTVTGSVDSSNVLTLVSAPFTGPAFAPFAPSTLRVQVPVPIPRTGALNGTIQVDGPTCNYASTPAIGIQYASITGTFSGAFTPAAIPGNPASGTANATLTLTQSATPTADGRFPVTGNIQFTGTACTTSTAVSGTITGGFVTLLSTPIPPAIFGDTDFTGAIDPTSSRFLFDGLTFNGPPCAIAFAPAFYTGNPTRQ